MRAANSETVAKAFAAVCIGLLLVQLAFRAFIYSRIPIEPGAPTGVSDLIELALGSALFLALISATLWAVTIALAGRRERVVASCLVAIVVAVGLSAGPLHSLVARWAST